MKAFLVLAGIVTIGLLLAVPVLAASPFGGSGSIPTGNAITLRGIEDLIYQVYGFIVRIAGIIIVGFLIWGGVLWATAGANDKQVESAKKTIWAAVYGAAIVLGVGVIISTVGYLIDTISLGSF